MDRSSHSLSFSPSCSPFPTYTAAFQATVKPIQKGIRIHFHWKHFVLSCHLLLYQPPNPHMPFLWSLVSHIWKPRVFGHCVLQRSLRELLFFTSNSPLKTCAYAYDPNSLDNIDLNVFFFLYASAKLILKIPHVLQILTFIVFMENVLILSPEASAEAVTPSRQGVAVCPPLPRQSPCSSFTRVAKDDFQLILDGEFLQLNWGVDVKWVNN